MNGTKEIAQRIVNAENSMIDEIVEQFGFSENEAEKILKVFKKAKAVKLDVYMGRYELTHGAFWCKEVMKNALNIN